MKPLSLVAIILIFFILPAWAQEPITITAVGDIMMGTDWPESLLPPDEGKGIFDSIKEHLQGDIVFGNLEGPITNGGTPAKCKKPSKSCYEFRTPPSFTARLKEAGFNTLSVANNHSRDFGIEGLEDTLVHLNTHGIQPVGGKAVATFDIRGQKVALVGFSYIYSPYSYSIFNLKTVSSIIKKLKIRHDIVVVSVHAGGEGIYARHINDVNEYFYGEGRGDVKKFAHGAIDAGADLVLGHGPHVLRALELYKGKLIAYSLGNFLTYERFNISGPSGLSAVLSVQIDPLTGDFIEGSISPVRLHEPGIPRQDHQDHAVSIISTLTAEDFDAPGLIIADTGRLLPDHPKVTSVIDQDVQ